ncbi:MAG: tRNA (adenosine(37)-N6)-threonylcarbamoyltransferase complex transferase subunit TsaD [Deltaproteobacteria bacterium]|nr:tRNA (adenosine(37)-N6)-threonylcarbamoyltransferase complex transferase subunit TsaD [Deltaproteobacteria bacterium]
MLVLGIETSCDETAAAVVKDGTSLLSNIVFSQMDVHSKYGGIVPEIASRKHIEAIAPVICQALENARLSAQDIEGIAVTRGPGLIGSLLVGLSAAKAFALARNIPFVGVNHLEGHVSAIFLTDTKPVFPFIALIVSGGHTVIYLVKGAHDFQAIGQTRDDAAGEAFDKAAKLLDIGYPGGLVIDRLAKQGDRRRIQFPRAMRDSLDFSFSGVKTSLLSMVKKKGSPFDENELPDVAAGYQEAIVEVLVEKTIRAAKVLSIKQIVVCGGVASNSRLREKFLEETQANGMEVFIPPAHLCTDNAAMIAVVGDSILSEGRRDDLDLNAISRWPLELLDTCSLS